MLRIFIAVGLNPDGTYKILVYPDDESQAGARNPNAGRNDPVIWTVSNLTEKKLTVKVTNFVAGSLKDPVQFAKDSVEVKPADEGNGLPRLGNIVGVVKQTATPASYSYDVLVNGTTVVDPKLRVDNGEIVLPRTRRK